MLRQNSFDSQSCFDLFSYHFAWWSRTAWGGSIPSVSDIYRSPMVVLFAPQLMVFRPNISWTSPPQGIIKINVDGSFSKSYLASGTGGVFRNHHSFVLLQFAKKVQAYSTIHTKVLAIKEGMLVTTASWWASSVTFTFELDSMNTTTWFLEPSKVP